MRKMDGKKQGRGDQNSKGVEERERERERERMRMKEKEIMNMQLRS